jgi:hypothetical protein
MPVRVMRIATGEIEEDQERRQGVPKRPQGGNARARRLIAKQRSEIDNHMHIGRPAHGLVQLR